ncbi:hypothetical protein JG688_00010632 [Phytophthora aleatoria]|uniref:Uncharacterized protein n=1 Tax=Phytophthora aleatoria TaxID=2496075 RepID=A0A8J5MFE1_9STRA|nr:hypothetical protein JG688_00010632 [Phytophthora aleatoria]
MKRLTKKDDGNPSKRPRTQASRKTLFVDVAVKSYSFSQVGPENILEECAKFEALIDRLGSPTEREAEYGIITSVLLVCATNYSRSFMNKFKSNPGIRAQTYAHDNQ